MAQPPPGYDDESVIHKSQLKKILEDFEGELTRIQNVFDQKDTSSPKISQDILNSFFAFKQEALELGDDYSNLLDELDNHCALFSNDPSLKNLSMVCSDVKSLQLLLSVS